MAHPRRCGADSAHSTRAVGRRGSSPQVRGRYSSALVATASLRLIPAGAGQMARSRLGTLEYPAHPRRCGADLKNKTWQSRRDGSSPQVRGRLLGHASPATTQRLIPAGAGQIVFDRCLGGSLWAHPRRCGADEMSTSQKSSVGGSSPQVRGRCYLSRGDERRFWVLALALFLLVSATVCGSGTCCGLCSSRCAAVGEAVARGGV